MSKKSKNPKYVTEKVCAERIQKFNDQLHNCITDIKKIKEALIGKLPEGGGLVKKVEDVSKQLEEIDRSSLSTRDKATIVASLIVAISGIIIALVK